MYCCACLLQYARAPVNTEIWWSAQGRVHLLCPNPAFWDVVLLRQCIHMTHTMYLPPRCADPPRPWPENWVMKIQGVYVILLKWVFVTYIWQTKTMGRNWAYFQGISDRCEKKPLQGIWWKYAPHVVNIPRIDQSLCQFFHHKKQVKPTKFSDFL